MIARKHILSFVWLAILPASAVRAATFAGLGFLSGFTLQGTADGVSADGSTVIGTYTSTANNREGFRWKATSGVAGLPVAFSQAYGVSADGSAIAGTTASKGAARWTQSTGWASLGHLSGGTMASAIALGISGDGSAVVGYSGSTPGTQAFRWTQSVGMTSLGDLPGGNFYSLASGISADGSTVVGYSDSGTGGEAFRWSQLTGMVGLGYLPGSSPNNTFSSAQAASADGSVIVGYSTSADGQEAFRWTQATGMLSLGIPSLALATSADGSIIVGEAAFNDGTDGAFIWDAANGMRHLSSALVEDGLSDSAPKGWYLRRATGISADGRVIVGWGVNPAGVYEPFVATIPEPSTILLLPLSFMCLISGFRAHRKRLSL
jgi:probable HAF family extracellular repeat protein